MERFKKLAKGRANTIKEKKNPGGGTGYTSVRSKYVKGPDGYGKVITLAREKLIAKNGGKDPGPNVVAAHYEMGTHKEKDGGKARFKTRAWNSRESINHYIHKKK